MTLKKSGDVTLTVSKGDFSESIALTISLDTTPIVLTEGAVNRTSTTDATVKFT